MTSKVCAAGPPEGLTIELERHVREALRVIRYGTVTLVIQDGHVIQIDRSEKIRLITPGHIHGSGI
jgi:hypothetical protein